MPFELVDRHRVEAFIALLTSFVQIQGTRTRALPDTPTRCWASASRNGFLNSARVTPTVAASATAYGWVTDSTNIQTTSQQEPRQVDVSMNFAIVISARHIQSWNVNQPQYTL